MERLFAAVNETRSKEPSRKRRLAHPTDYVLEVIPVMRLKILIAASKILAVCLREVKRKVIQVLELGHRSSYNQLNGIFTVGLSMNSRG